MPVWLVTLIDRLLEKDPADRIQSAAEVAVLLEGYLAHLHQPLTVAAPKLPDAPARPRQRRKIPQLVKRIGLRTSLAATVCLVVLGTGLAYLLAGGSGGPGGQGKTGGSSEWKARFHQDLRSAEVKNPNLQAIGEPLRYEAEGVRITLPEEKGPHKTTGIATRFRVHGDFEITVAYEILETPAPKTGWGAGVSMFVAIDSEPNTRCAVSLARHIKPDRTIQFLSNRMMPKDGKPTEKLQAKPSKSAVGKLRIQRKGARVRFFYADGPRAGFTLLAEEDFGTEDIKWLQVGGDAGPAGSPVDLRLLEFTVLADELPQLLGGSQGTVAQTKAPVIPWAPPKAAGKGWWTVSIGGGVVLACLFAFGVRHYLRRGRRAPKELAKTPVVETPSQSIQEKPTQSKEEKPSEAIQKKPAQLEAAWLSVSVPCAACGKKLKVKSTLLGKKVKCPACGEAVLIREKQESLPE
jgi:predicted RNA-binding Zn-ribbon protein involved in translation (DUF1610 family)